MVGVVHVGIMSIVVDSGEIHAGDAICTVPPSEPFVSLQVV